MKYVDLTQTFTQNMPVYPGDAVPEIVQTAFLDKDGYNDEFLKTGMHVGTHLDAPWHMLQDGKKITDISLEKFFGAGHLIDARGKDKVTADLLNNVFLKKGDIVLVMTGCYKKYHEKDYFDNYPEISVDFATKLVEQGVSMVGVDTPSPDYQPWLVHKLLLQNNVLIIENLTNLESLLDVKSFEVCVLPMKLDTEAAPARVIAMTT